MVESGSWICSRTYAQAIEQRAEFEKHLAAILPDLTLPFGVKTVSIKILEYSLSGAMRSAHMNLLRTEIEGQIALAKARHESATLRSILNTARLVQENPRLMELRILASGQKPRVTFVIDASGQTSVKSDLVAAED